MSNSNLKLTPLDGLHRALGAKMVSFAGYSMPVQYPSGIIAEHRHTRGKAGLFDVSHMGQVRVTGLKAAKQIERLVTGDIESLNDGDMRYTLFTNEKGGVMDDLMVTNICGQYYLVVNAACKENDLLYMRDNLFGCNIEELEEIALLALQGPLSESILENLVPGVSDLKFMKSAKFEILGMPCLISRSGYTGEDGFEISVPSEKASEVAETILRSDLVKPAGLGARDSLRLEAGLCLYGYDLNPNITPIEAALDWVVGKRRRLEGGFPGAEVIKKQLRYGPLRKRIGIRPHSRAPARTGTKICTKEGKYLGEVTSGGYGATVESPISIGYINKSYSEPGHHVYLMVRGNPIPAQVSTLPFIKTNYKRN